MPLVELRLSVIPDVRSGDTIDINRHKRWQIIENIGVLTKLRILQIRCRLKNMHCKSLALVCPGIVSLDVQGNRFDIDGLEHLSDGMQELEKLVLGVSRNSDKICIKEVNEFFARPGVFCNLAKLEIHGVSTNDLTITNTN